MKLLHFSEMSFLILKSFFSIIVINIKIIYFKFKNKKIIFFYDPVNRHTQSINYIEDLFDNFGKEFLIFFGFNSPNISGHKNYYMKYNFLKWIYKVDIFLSNNVCDIFTNNSIKIYLHHDIYDSPLIDIKKEKELFQRLTKYDFLFLSNKKSTIMFNNFFDKYNSNLNGSIPKIMETGYLKLDYLKKNIKTYNSINNNIVIAPTIREHIKKLSMFDDLKKIIEILLTNTASKVIFRPHPINRKTHLTLEIEESFKNDNNFKLDISNDYFDTYLNSMCLITDISGTAYTYAFLTKKPVIFFSKSEELVDEFGYNERSYFKDRDKVGIIVKNLDEVLNAINNIKYIEKEIRISNSRLEKEEIYYLGNSKNRIKELINEILIEKK